MLYFTHFVAALCSESISLLTVLCVGLQSVFGAISGHTLFFGDRERERERERERGGDREREREGGGRERGRLRQKFHLGNHYLHKNTFKSHSYTKG